MQSLTIGIVGLGFSAVALTAQLIRQSNHPLHIVLFEKSPVLAKGIAYSTISPVHPLNVRAAHMGVLEDDPGDFYAWVVKNQEIWRKDHPYFERLELSPLGYFPRKLYGKYLSDFFHNDLEYAKNKGLLVEIIHQEVSDVDWRSEDCIEIHLKDEQSLQVGHLVLATGISPVKSLDFENDSLRKDERYITDIWSKPLPQSMQSSDKTVLIIGSGLSTVDALLSCAEISFQGKIVVLSPEAKFPEAHRKIPLDPIILLDPPHSLMPLIEFLNKEKRDGVEWKSLVDALRPFTQDIWNHFTVKEKKCFFEHLLSTWNKYRHRMPFECHQFIQNMIVEKKLIMLKGKVEKIHSKDQNLLEVEYRNDNEIICITADWIINCSGPEYSLEKQKNPLIKKMLKKKLIQADPLGLGVSLDQKRRNIHAMGSLLFGELFEITAIPELRTQAAQLAKKLLATI